MNKSILYLFLISLIFSCQHKIDSQINKNDFKGKTFDIIFEAEKDTIGVITFNDTTHQFLAREKWKMNLPWRIAEYQNSSFLILENRASGIEKIDSHNFKLLFLGAKDENLIMSERVSKWTKEQIFGTWVEDIFVGRDSSEFPPPSPPPPPPPYPVKVNWPPSYTISEDKIIFDHFGKTESQMEITNNAEFLALDYDNSNSYNHKKMLWKIKFLTDSIMIIDREIIAKYSSSELNLKGFHEGQIKLIRAK
jgi:hypothetical protein